MIGDKLRETAPGLCNASIEEAPLIFWCDLPEGHGGRHVERWVASWKTDDTDLREYVGDTKDGRAVYRSMSESPDSAQQDRRQ